MQSLIDDIIHRYDFVFIATMASASFAVNHNVRKYLDMIDSFTMYYEKKRALSSSWISRMLLKFEAKRMRGFEHTCHRSFNRTAYISEVDRHYVSPEDTPTAIVGNAIKLPVTDSLYCSHNPDSRDIVFVGKMNYEPNELAVINFAKNVLPIINSGNDTYRFIIVGTNPTKRVAALTDLPNVIVTGFVDSVIPYYVNSALVVAPMLSGSGIQNKILEAMYLGCCVVTTPIGQEGITHLNDGYVLSELSPEIMATMITGLLEKPEKRKAIGEKAHELVSEYFNHDRIRREFFNFIEERDF